MAEKEMSRDIAIGEVDRIVSHLRIFEHAKEILNKAHADEAGIKGREKRLAELGEEITRAEDELAELQEQRKKEVKKKQDEIQQLEEEQQGRIRAATEKAGKAIAEADQRRKARVAQINSELQLLEARLRGAKEETEQEEAMLAEAQKKRSDFIRSVTR
jgi:chromosome segregation ATPase